MAGRNRTEITEVGAERVWLAVLYGRAGQARPQQKQRSRAEQRKWKSRAERGIGQVPGVASGCAGIEVLRVVAVWFRHCRGRVGSGSRS